MPYTTDRHYAKVYLQDRPSAAYKAYSQMHGTCRIQHYAVNSMLYLWTIKDKYIKIYNEFILQLWIYAKALRILA